MQLPDFHPVIRDWFQINYPEVTPPQQQGWPVIANGNHTLILAPTGSGKTLAAFLWCIDDLFKNGLIAEKDRFEKNQTGVHTLYISPLKALNNDIERNLQIPLSGITAYANNLKINPPGIRVAVRTGDTTPGQRQSMLRKPPHILITTPESLYLLLTTKGGRRIFSNLIYLIVDEIHALCGNKRGVHLSLTIERLMALCKQEPVRIGLSATQKPLERIAAYLGGWRYLQNENIYHPREVSIIDCGRRKKLDLKVKSPVKSFSDLPGSSVWPQTIKLLYEEINAHKTTLIFVNMRAQAERIARQLNEYHQRETGSENTEIALAHHGSMSREMRFDVESRLKESRIPAVIATGSLELGIDIGGIDLVIQLEAPRTISSAIQRIGRSGHLYQAVSKGYIVPLYPADLDDAVALSKAVCNNAIEETIIPENCLDVLAQQIVAEIAVCEWSRPELFVMIKQSYCYHNLPDRAFNHVLEMLSGRYAENRLPSLQARISWDQVNDRLLPRKGSGIVALMNGGTIPDRGYFSVYLSGSSTRLGEVEEEFVFESRIGDTFFLGNNEWLIEEISQDRITVTTVQAIKPKAPFWKGGLAYRDIATVREICIFRESLVSAMENNTAESWLNRNYSVDPFIVSNLIQYFKRQMKATGHIASHKKLVVEIFRDSNEETNLIIQAPFGMRVNATWVLILTGLLEEKLGCQVLTAHNDDGILLRLGEHSHEIPIKSFLSLSPENAEKYLMQQLPSTYLFAITFRHNAMRALLLPRSQPNKRIPLWLQRLKSADILQAVRKFPDFPILAETYRECLQDIFNLNALKKILTGLENGEITIEVAHTSSPSPMSAGLIFNYLSTEVYDYDRVRAPAEAAAVSSTLLTDLLNTGRVPSLLTPALVRKTVNHLQHLSPASRASGAEDIYAIIEQLQPISYKELLRRSKNDPAAWLQQLEQNHRIIKKTGGYVISETAPHASGHTRHKIKVRHVMQVNGPLTLRQISESTGIEEAELSEILVKLEKERLLVKGTLLENSNQEYWCDRDNYTRLYRTAVSERRQQIKTLPFRDFYKFQFNWHHLGSKNISLDHCIQQLQGYALPPTLWEREIFPARLQPGYTDQLKQLIYEGQLIVRCRKESQSIYFHRRNEGHVFSTPEEKENSQIYQFIKENNSCIYQDIIDGTGLNSSEVEKTLSQLLLSDYITCDNFDALLYLLLDYKPEKTGANSLNRRRAEKKIHGRMKLYNGRWYTTNAFNIKGKAGTAQQQIERLTEILLLRHGVLVKEWYRKETIFLPWYQIFQTLKRWEWQGKIRRGFFIEGLSGLQYALPEAVSLIESIRNGEIAENRQAIIQSTLDPGLPLGGHISWNLNDRNGQPVTVSRTMGNHLILIDGTVVAYTENYALRITTLDACTPEHLAGICAALKQLLLPAAPYRLRKNINIGTIDGTKARATALGEVLINEGFEDDGLALTLWPSAL